VTALTGMNSTIGTASYMSPEQCKGDRNLTAKSDLYSLGIVLYELVTGKKPFVTESSVEMFLKHVNEIPVRPSRHVADLPVWVDNLIMFLLEKEKDNRPLDAAIVGRMLGEIEEKVHTQKSAGAEAANARRIDRVANDDLNDEDREVAKMIRSAGKGKKRKKKIEPWYTKQWVKALPLVLASVGIAAGLYFIFKPVSKEVLLARIEAAASDEGKIKLGEEYLARYGNQVDETTERVRGIVISLKGKEWETQLHKRFTATGARAAAWRKAQEGEDELAYEYTIRAMDSEKAGNLVAAASEWTRVKDLLAQSSDKRKAEWAWLADKRIKDGKEADDNYKKLKSDFERIQLDELPWKLDHTDVKSLACLATRLETFGDKPKAREKWLLVQKDADGSSTLVPWYLLANRQAALLVPDKDEPAAERVKRIEAYVTNTENRSFAKSDEVENVINRKSRNRYRDVIELYSDENDPMILDYVKRATELLKKLATAGGE
jgi:eukaryotic-like serine/threonine-protein kinase